MAIVKQLNKKTGVTYVYESHSYRDKETKKPRSRRKLIGRIDDETGEIVPTQKRKINVSTNAKHDVATTAKGAVPTGMETVLEMESTITAQRREIALLRKEREEIASKLEKLVAMLKA